MQTTRDIRFFPDLDLSSVGVTPTGQALFRVVWAPSRIDTVVVARTGEIKQIQTYLHPGWILEKWQSEQEFYQGMAPEEYKKASMDLGGFTKRYESEGEYDAVYTFDTEEEVSLAHLYATSAQFGNEHLSLAQRRQIIDFHQERESRRVAQQRRDIIAEAAPSKFGRVAERHQFYDADGRTIQL